MITSGKLDLVRLVGDRISIEEAPAALATADAFLSVGVTVVTKF